MISKNFEFIKELGDSESYEMISILEDKIGEKDFPFDIELGKVLEYKLGKLLKTREYSLSRLTEMLKDSYLEKNQEIMPHKIFSALKSLSNSRNQFAHYDEGVTQTLFAAKVNNLNTIRTIYYFLFKAFEDKKYILELFNEDIYYEKSNKMKIILKDEKEVYDYDSNQIQLQKVSIGDLVLDNKKEFLIPSYQRNYKWQKENCEGLMDEILNNYLLNKDIYFGTMAITVEEQENKDSEENTIIRLIDGQQRTTTSLILFRAIFDVLKELNTENNRLEEVVPKALCNIFFNKDTALKKEFNSSLIKVKNATADSKSNEALKIVLGGNSLRVDRTDELFPHRFTQVVKNYETFKLKLLELSSKQISEIFSYFSNRYYISCINFQIDTSEEMEVFETLNSKGMDLSVSDLLKNFMFNLLKKEVYLSSQNEIVKIYSKYFDLETDPILSKDKDSQKIDSLYSTFFFNFLSYKLINHPSAKYLKQDKKSILNGFKQLYGNKRNLDIDKFTKICQEVGKYLYIFQIIETEKYKDRHNELYPFKDTFKYTSHKDISVLTFYLIDLASHDHWDSYSKKLILDNQDKVAEAFFEIEKWLTFLIQVNGTGQSLKNTQIQLVNYLKKVDQFGGFINKLPNTFRDWFAGNIKEDRENIGLLINEAHRMPTKKQILESISQTKIKNTPIAAVLLQRLENYYLNVNNNGQQTLTRSTPTLEHIMPQKISKEWISSMGYKNDLEFNRLYVENLNKIGNYLLIDKKNNSELGNSEFSKKQKNFQENNNVLAKIPYGMSGENLLNAKKFDFNSIKDRSVKMASIIVEDIYGIQ